MGLFEAKSTKAPTYSITQRACLNSTPTKNSSASSWKQWHSTLIRCFGKSGANDVWVMAWDRYGRSNSNAYSTALATYMQSQGVSISQSGGEHIANAYSNIFSSIGGIFNFMKIVNMVVAGGIAVGFPPAKSSRRWEQRPAGNVYYGMKYPFYRSESYAHSTDARHPTGVCPLKNRTRSA